MSPYPHVPLEGREPLQLEYENGKLVKINGMRPEYMDGYRLLNMLRQMADALNAINDIVYANPTLSREDYFKIRFLARTAAYEPKKEEEPVEPSQHYKPAMKVSRAKLIEMLTEYEAGATVSSLARKYEVNRTTMDSRLSMARNLRDRGGY